MEEKIRAILIIEIAGRPKEHLVESLKEHIHKFDQIKGIELMSESYSDPRQIEDKDFYTCFAEVEIEVESFTKLTEVIFDFMPASVEVIKPDKVEFNMNDATSFLNNISGRLHRYDEVVKIANLRMQQMVEQFQKMQQENIKKNRQIVEENSKKKPKSVKKKVKKGSKKGKRKK